MYCIQHCFICRPTDSTVSEDAGIEPRTVATSALSVRRSNHYARSHPHYARSHPLAHYLVFFLICCLPTWSPSFRSTYERNTELPHCSVFIFLFYMLYPHLVSIVPMVFRHAKIGLQVVPPTGPGPRPVSEAKNDQH
jgi:hypothetical protein